MADAVEIWERPKAETIYMLAGWRQWADAGSISSGLPEYLVEQTNARKIGELRSDGFYLFQIPGTHDLVRPVVKFKDGFPQSLESRRNEFFYTGNEQRGVVLFLGDEPHMDVERYTTALLDAAESLKVKRIVGLGGVYGELPYDKERLIGGIYSIAPLKDEMQRYAINPSDYHGGASIGSYICRRAGERDMEFVAFYAFVPTYDFTNFARGGNTIRIENDHMAWLTVMRRINYMFKTNFELADLEDKSEDLLRQVESKVEELDRESPQLGVRDYMKRLSDTFTEKQFDPLDDVWEDALRGLLDDDE